MNEVVISSLALLVMVITSVIVAVLLRKHRSQKSQLNQQVSNERISEALTAVAEQAEQRRLRIHLPAKEFDSMKNLSTLSESFPRHIQKDVEQLETLWQVLDDQIAIFNNQPAHSTMQSSILTSKTLDAADEIEKLVSITRRKLD